MRAWRRCFGALFAASSGLPEGAWQAGLDHFAEGFGGTRVNAYVLIRPRYHRNAGQLASGRGLD